MKNLKKLICSLLLVISFTSFMYSLSGVKINIEEVEDATLCQIYKKNNEKDGTKSYSSMISYWDYEEDKTKVLYDYFVNPNESYSYTITYKKQGDYGWEIIKTSYFSVTPKEGLGEENLEPGLRAEYDEKTGIMTLNKFPSLTKEATDFLKSFPSYKESKNEFILRYDPPNEGFAALLKRLDTTTIDCSYDLRGCTFYEKDQIYNTPLEFESFNISLEVNGIGLSRYVKQSEIEGLPKVIIVPEKEEIIEVKATKQGIELVYPPQAFGANRDRRCFERYIKEGDEYILDQEITLDHAPSISEKIVVDYFVQKGKEYYYCFSYRDNISYDIMKTDKVRVVAIGGCGELALKGKPKVEYDEEKGIMTFPKGIKRKTKLEKKFTPVGYEMR